MFDFDKWTEIFQSLRRHKMRTILTALAVWWGIFMLVILLGASNGLQNSFERDFADDALNSIWIYPSSTTIPYKGLKPGRRIIFHNDDYEMLRKDENIAHVTGRFYIWNDVKTEYKGKAQSINIRSLHPDHRYIENTKMLEGRYVNDRDIEEYRKVAVIGTLAKEDLIGKDGGSIVGEIIEIGGIPFTIVGEFVDPGNDYESRKMYLPITTAQRAFAKDDVIHQLMVIPKSDDVESSLAMTEEIRKKIAVKHKFDPDDRQALYVNARIEEYMQFQNIFSAMSIFIWFVGVGSILAGIVGVSNIMLIVVKDRTREIGIRKAIGATPISIVGMVLQEAVFLTSVSGYIGLLTGFSVIYGINYILTTNDVEMDYFYNPNVDFGSVVIALIFLVVCGTLAGVIPAIQAARVNPIVAMRD